jgi:hypothetical protein
VLSSSSQPASADDFGAKPETGGDADDLGGPPMRSPVASMAAGKPAEYMLKPNPS